MRCHTSDTYARSTVQHTLSPRELEPECPEKEALWWEESVPTSPPLSGCESTLWPVQDPGLMRDGSQGMKHSVLEHEGSTAQPQRHTLGISGRMPLIGGRGSEKKSLHMSGDRDGQYHGIRRGTIGSKSWALYHWASFSLESSSTAPWSGSEAGGMLGQAAGHRLWVGLVSL